MDEVTCSVASTFRRIVYISCNPETMVRDLQRIVAQVSRDHHTHPLSPTIQPTNPLGTAWAAEHIDSIRLTDCWDSVICMHGDTYICTQLKAGPSALTIEKFACFDQFPYTHHLECGALVTISEPNPRAPLAPKSSGGAGESGGNAMKRGAVAPKATACEQCGEKFESRSALFRHIKAKGHATEGWNSGKPAAAAAAAAGDTDTGGGGEPAAKKQKAAGDEGA